MARRQKHTFLTLFALWKVWGGGILHSAIKWSSGWRLASRLQPLWVTGWVQGGTVREIWQGPCATGEGCGQSLEVGGLSCPAPLTSNSVLSYCTPSKGKADPTLPMLPAQTKVETSWVGDLAGLGR